MSEDGSVVERRIDGARTRFERLRTAVGGVIIGQHAVVEQVLWALLAGGHVLLEGAPGLGKTLLVKTLANCLHLQFSRIQFTPDLMPSDITGSNILVLDERGSSTGRFELHRGPLFAQLVLADEVNRASPKTQSALLEAMQEHSVTIAGEHHTIPPPFMVLATENPIEMEGTYPLPEAQLDRFLFKILVPAPDDQELETILDQTTGRSRPPPEAVLSGVELSELQQLCRDVVVPRPVLRYATTLTARTSPESEQAPASIARAVRFGAGVRGGQSLLLGSKARALAQGRGNVSFEDVQVVARPALRHRLILSFEGEAENVDRDQLVSDVLDSLAALPAEAQQAL